MITGYAMLHLGVEDGFAAAHKAHPAFLVENLDTLAGIVGAAGYACTYSDDVPRFHTSDPFGNRLEFQQA